MDSGGIFGIFWDFLGWREGPEGDGGVAEAVVPQVAAVEAPLEAELEAELDLEGAELEEVDGERGVATKGGAWLFKLALPLNWAWVGKWAWPEARGAWPGAHCRQWRGAWPVGKGTPKTRGIEKTLSMLLLLTSVS